MRLRKHELHEHVYSTSFKDSSPALRAHIFKERTTKSYGFQHDPIACRHQRFVQFVHDTELQILHVSILEFECVCLESKLSNLLGVCSDVLLRSSVQLLHPDCRPNTHRQSTGSTTRINLQVDSLTHLSATALAQRFPLLWAFHRRCACLRIFSQACQCRRLYLSCRLTAPMKRPGTSSLAFSPDG